MTETVDREAPVCPPWCTVHESSIAGWNSPREPIGTEAEKVCFSPIATIHTHCGTTLTVDLRRYAELDYDAYADEPTVMIDTCKRLTVAQARDFIAALQRGVDLIEAAGERERHGHRA